MVLLVVDTQKLITTPDLYNFNAFECAVKSLIATARENNVEVIYVRHDDGAGAELTKGTPGFEIYEGFGPQPSEKIFDKTVNSSFKGTGLLEYLAEKNVHTVAVDGCRGYPDVSLCILADVHRHEARVGGYGKNRQMAGKINVPTDYKNIENQKF